MADDTSISASSRYEAMSQLRTEPLDRARKNARLTLPYIMPPDNHDEGTALYDPFQSVGAQGTLHLSSKLTLAVMPPNEPFFRHSPDEFVGNEMEDMKEGTLDEAMEEIARHDRTGMQRIEASGDRVKVELANRHLLICGNVLLDVREEKARVIGMDHYVVLRDNTGTVIEAAIKESIHPSSAPEVVRKSLEEQEGSGGGQDKAAGDKKSLDLFTHIQLKSDGMYHGFQEVEGEMVPGTEFRKKPEDLGLLFLRFTVIDGQSWGRAHVESLYGDLVTLEGLTQAVTDVAAAATRVIFLVEPNSTTKAKDLNDASNFSFITGDANHITTLQLDKMADLRIALEMIERIEKRMEQMFLMRNSATRDAERVTAEEIRYIALEIDDALAGIFTLLSQEFQLPYARLRLKQMKDLPSLPKDTVNLTITTGLEALRRGHELQKLQMLQRGITEAYGPGTFDKIVSPTVYAKRLAASLGIGTRGLVLEPEEAEATATAGKVTDAVAGAAPQIMQSQGIV